MVVWLKQSTPLVAQAIPRPSQASPEVTSNGQWLTEKISEKIDNLIEIGLSARNIVTNNHSANVNAFSAHFGKKYSIQNEIVIYSTHKTVAKHTYFMGLFILWKTSETRNLFLSSLYLLGWCIQHDKDKELESNLRIPQKLSYLALQLGNNKQNVPLALETTITEARSYFPNWRDVASFLKIWWTISNYKRKFSPNILRNAMINGDKKLSF